MGVDPTTQQRTAWLPFVFSFLLVGFGLQIAWLQVAAGTWGKNRAAVRPSRMRTLLLPARRGTIYTRDGAVLAVSVDRQMLTANPRVPRDIAKTAHELAQLTGESETFLRRQLQRRTKPDGRPNRYVRLCRDVPDEALAGLKPRRPGALELSYMNTCFRGVHLRTWRQRRYPFGSLAAHLVGRVAKDGAASLGIERRYDEHLRGENGEVRCEVDGDGYVIPHGVSHLKPARQGQNLVLTIDENIQQTAQRAIAEALHEFNAEVACALVLHPGTGQVLAWAAEPSFDPNKVRVEDVPHLRNWPVTYVFEPGSTLKPLVAAAVVDNLKGWERKRYECSGVMKLGNHKKRCWILSETGHGHGNESLSDAVCHSCNIVMMRFGLQLHPQVLYDTFQRFGLFARTGCDCSYEERGYTASAKDWSLQRHADVCYGQGVCVTPLALTCAIAALGNGGKLMRPYVASHAVEESGRVIPLNKPTVVRQAVSPQTARTVTKMMVRVMEEGTGKQGRVPGVRIAGKTGSAQIAIDGHYPEGHYICTFVGFGPVEAPRVCVFVMVVEPQGTHWSSKVCAPAFRTIMQEALLDTEIRPVEPAPWKPGTGLPDA